MNLKLKDAVQRHQYAQRSWRETSCAGDDSALLTELPIPALETKAKITGMRL